VAHSCAETATLSVTESGLLPPGLGNAELDQRDGAVNDGLPQRPVAHAQLALRLADVELQLRGLVLAVRDVVLWEPLLRVNEKAPVRLRSGTAGDVMAGCGPSVSQHTCSQESFVRTYAVLDEEASGLA